MEGVLLQAEGLRFSYGRRPVLADVSLTLRAGEMVGVVGPNGSGKSTLLRLISGVLRPSAGRLYFKGKSLADLGRRELARRMAVVPQNPHLPESFTVEEVVLLGRTPHLGLLQGEGPRDLAAAHRAMELSGITGLAGRRVGELSGGERQRTLIARALAQEPSILLLDEPTAHLDVSHQIGILDTMARLSSESGLAILAVFHDLNLAAQYCDWLIILSQGRVLAAGPPQEIITTANIRTAFGADVLVLAHPINDLPVTLVTRRNGPAATGEQASMH